MLTQSLATISAAAKRIIELIEKDLPAVVNEDAPELLAS
jgi:hypothetical protein